MSPDDRLCRCDNCGKLCKLSQLLPLHAVVSLGSRLDPGSEVPAGECLCCGALSYLVKEGADDGT